MMFNQYPYLNVNDLNLDYILAQIKTMMNEVTNFVSINAIKYADPIQWDITRQYEKNTVVIDPVTGTAYISVAPVPAGVALTRPEYWTVVFDLGSFVTRAAQNFTSRYEQDTTLTATFPTNTGEWLVWGDVLYKALSNIIAGDTYVVGSNIEHFTIEDLYNAYLNTIAQILAAIGDVNDLTTTDKSNVVNAINEVNSIAVDNQSHIINANIFNVKDYGAIGDGVHDDTQLIQDTIDAAQLTGGTVYFPTGTYLLTDTLYVTTRINLIGEGVSRSMLYRKSDYGSTIKFGDDSIPTIDGFEIAYLFFYHDFGGYENGHPASDMVNKPTTGAHLEMYNPIRMYLHDCNIWNMPYNLQIYGSSKCNIIHNTFRGLWDSSNLPLQVTTANIALHRSTSALTGYLHPTDVHIRDNDITGYLSETRNIIYGNYTYSGVQNIGAMYGILCEGCEVLQISGGNIGGQHYGVELIPKTGNSMLSVTIEGVFFDGNDVLAINATNENGSSMGENLLITNCHFIGQNNSYHALWIGGASAWTLPSFNNVIISNNTFGNYEGHVMAIFKARNVSIVNNDIRDYNTNAGFDGSVYDAVGVYIGSVDGLTISDNSFGGGFTYEDHDNILNHCYLGIYFESGADHVHVSNNALYPDKVYLPIMSAISDYSSYDFEFVNNQGFNGVYLVNATDVGANYVTPKKNPHARPAMLQITASVINDVVINAISQYQNATTWFGYISPSDTIQITGTDVNLKYSLK